MHKPAPKVWLRYAQAEAPLLSPFPESWLAPTVNEATQTVRLRHLRGRNLLADTLKTAGLTQWLHCPLRYSTKGKPAFSADEAPAFSLSHAEGLTVCALCAQPLALGVDIELRPPADTDALSVDFLEAERKHVAGSPERFLAVWTRKEALGKAVGSGLDESIFGTEVLEKTARFNGKTYRFAPLRLPDGYVGHLAIAAQSFTLNRL